VILGPGETLDDRMMAFQREGVKFGLARGGRVLVRRRGCGGGYWRVLRARAMVVILAR
jgi:hypothetical protein